VQHALLEHHSPLEKTTHKAANGELPISYRNRHCPKCQAGARDRWLAKRHQELLPTHYVHVVFTLPSRLAPLALQNKKIIYNLLFRASAETLLEVARDPRHLGAEIGFFSVLHTCLLRACGPRNLMKIGSS
jgi:transposase-like zinc-binding protein